MTVTAESALNARNTEPIGIFDSGIGGLTVFKEVRKSLPHENIIYLGDTARVPYGIRSPQTVIKYSMANTDFLLKQHIKLLVIACNTASAVATDALRKNYSMPIVDVVSPGAHKAVAVSRNKRIGIIGTEGTIRSGAYQREVTRLDPRCETFAYSCPLFVPLAEEGWYSRDDEVVLLVARRYLAQLKECGIDTLVLGCTHYPLLKEAIQAVMGTSVTLIDSAEEIAREVRRELEVSLKHNSTPQEGKNNFYLTDIPHRFAEAGRRFLGEALGHINLIDI